MDDPNTIAAIRERDARRGFDPEWKYKEAPELDIRTLLAALDKAKEQRDCSMGTQRAIAAVLEEAHERIAELEARCDRYLDEKDHAMIVANNLGKERNAIKAALDDRDKRLKAYRVTNSAQISRIAELEAFAMDPDGVIAKLSTERDALLAALDAERIERETAEENYTRCLADLKDRKEYGDYADLEVKMLKERIAELEATTVTATRYTERCLAMERVEKERDALKAALASTHFHHKTLIEGCPECDKQVRELLK